MKALLTVPLIFALALSSGGTPPSGVDPAKPDIKLPLGQPLSSWSASYGPPKSDNGKNAIFQTPEGTAYVVLGDSGLTECASLVANISNLNRLVDIVTEVCHSLEMSYKDDVVGPKGKFHRYESLMKRFERRLLPILRNLSSSCNPSCSAPVIIRR